MISTFIIWVLMPYIFNVVFLWLGLSLPSCYLLLISSIYILIFLFYKDSFGLSVMSPFILLAVLLAITLHCVILIVFVCLQYWSLSQSTFNDIIYSFRIYFITTYLHFSLPGLCAIILHFTSILIINLILCYFIFV